MPKLNASAEASVVKVDNPTLNIAPALNVNVSPKENVGTGAREPFICRVLSGTKKALHPIDHEKEQAEVRAIRSASEAEALASRERAIAEACRICLEGNPWMTKRQAYLHVMGYPLTRAGAETVFEVFEKASDALSGAAAVENLSDEFKDASVKGAASAYDDEIRKMWARLIAGEISKPGSFSKRTMSALESMDKNEADASKKVCEYSISINFSSSNDTETPFEPLIVLALDESGGSYNKGDIPISSLGVLDSLGLVDTSLARTHKIIPSMLSPFRVGSDVVVVENEGSDAVDIKFSHAIFLPIGEELAKVCGIGGGANLRAILDDKLTALGLKTTWHNMG